MLSITTNPSTSSPSSSLPETCSSNPTEQQLIATGFNRLNMMTREGGAQPAEYMAKYAADRVRTVGMAWMGATIGCAECHDHKFDPFTTKDFYALGAFFSDVKQWGVYSHYASSPNEDLKGFSNVSPFPPELELFSPTLLQHQRLIEQQMLSWIASHVLIRSDREASSLVRQWCSESIAFLDEHPDGWFQPKFVGLISTAEKAAELQPANLVRSDVVELEDADEKSKGKADEKKRLAELKSRTLRYAIPPGRIARIRIELFSNPKSTNRLTRSDATTLDVKLSAELHDPVLKKKHLLAFYRAEADRFEIAYADGQPKLGVEEGWRLGSSLLSNPAHVVYWLDAPVASTTEQELRLKIDGDRLAGIRVSLSPISDADLNQEIPSRELLESVASEEVSLTSSLGLRVLRSYFFSTQFDSKLHKKLSDLLGEYRTCRNGKTWSMFTVGQPRFKTRVLGRGNWQDETGDVVAPSVPSFLPQPPEADQRPLSRLDLARWLVSRENPLTARVVVNRLWKQFFGNGLSSTVDDVGTQGEPPSHPELLDWLAVELIESGWDIKHMVKLMVTSQCYQKSSHYREDLRDIDPSNRWLASQNARRLEAEFVRDNALSVAGLLDLRLVGGPSCKPYQPPGYYSALQFPDREYLADSSYGQFRRGVYMHWQRTFLHPMVANFDGPSREECVANRVSSNTPQQALTLLNDPSMVESARVMAASLLITKVPIAPSRKPTKESDAKRIGIALQRALGRAPVEEEVVDLQSFLEEQRKHYSSHEEAAKHLVTIGNSEPASPSIPASELAAWTAVCRVILNLHETITRY